MKKSLLKPIIIDQKGVLGNRSETSLRSFYGMTEADLEKLFNNSNKFWRKAETQEKINLIKNRPPSNPEFSNLPSSGTGEIINYDQFSPEKYRDFKTFIREKYGFLAYGMQSAYDYYLLQQFSDFFEKMF